ncbi:MAG: acetyl-CoA carboxylase, carboxyltransferase subunit beta [Clostridia bacterium]|nr:acetyl-CoA carboxylase, carboxyltransferase subunit beta [Clostridia bacterium]
MAIKFKDLFKSSKQEAEKIIERHVESHAEKQAEKAEKHVAAPQQEDGTKEITKTCPVCGTENSVGELWENLNVCKCGYHFKMNARQRIAFLVGNENFEELNGELVSENILDFPGYDTKLKSAKLNSHEKESVVTGVCNIGGYKVALFVMDAEFMMGSMGTVTGEKITKIFEYATENHLPVVGYTVSGGARMQEGILSLMQMAKTSGAVKRHSDEGNLYITVLTDPTTGGVTASFAMEGDIILAEPNATVGFAGRRVIEQTIKKKLPNEFQKSEFLLEHGFVDSIVARKEQKEVLKSILSMHVKSEADGNFYNSFNHKGGNN